MTDLNQQLRQFGEQVARKKQLDAQHKELQNQRHEIEAKVQDLDRKRIREQADVAQLHKCGLTSLLYRFTGKMDEKFAKENDEVLAAQAKYEVACKELEAVKTRIEQCQNELLTLHGCERRYAQTLQTKSDAVRASNTKESAEILRLELEFNQFQYTQKELEEAITAGRKALHTSEAVLKNLKDANGFATWDMLGGGLIADMAKHSHLDNAQAQVHQLQQELRRFKTEMADVTLHDDMQVNVDGFLRFADYFFDGLFADWAVKDKIHRSRSQVENTRQQISSVLNKLDAMLHDVKSKQQSAGEQINALILYSKL